MEMLFGVDSYFRVEIEELTELSIYNYNPVYVSQNEGWAWDKFDWIAEYDPKKHYDESNPLTFLNGNRSIISYKKSYSYNYIFSNHVFNKNQ